MPSNDENNNEEAAWQYKNDDNMAPEEPSSQADTNPEQDYAPVSWTASEFIEHQRDPGWYVLFAGGMGLVSLLVFVFTRDYISSAVIILAGIIFIIVDRRKPRQLDYEISSEGIRVGTRLYQYETFKSFDLGREGVIGSINLMPLQRFMPEVSIYFPPEKEEAIINVLSSHLPHDAQVEKAVDKLARKLRL